MAEALVLLVTLVVAGAVVLVPLWRERHAATALATDEREAAEARHRVALEALRDVEADRRAGLLDETAHASLLAEAEVRAAETRAGLDRAGSPRAPKRAPDRRRWATVAAVVIGAVVLLGTLVPATGLANATVVNRALADAQAAEREREDRIAELRDALAADPSDPATLSELADLHLAGDRADDLARAAAALQLLIALEPDRADAYERIVAAYLRAGDHVNARAALDAYGERPTADPAEVAFFDGLIALRGENDAEGARKAFDRFLELAPDDPRVDMIRGLRDEAAGAGR